MLQNLDFLSGYRSIASKSIFVCFQGWLFIPDIEASGYQSIWIGDSRFLMLRYPETNAMYYSKKLAKFVIFQEIGCACFHLDSCKQPIIVLM